MPTPELPNCPVSLRDRVWIEYRIGWLMEHLGRDRMTAIPKALPVAEDFPIPYDGSEESIQDHFRRIADWMGINITQIQLSSFDKKEAPYAAGLYGVDEDGVTTIWYERSGIRDPESLVATLAHELSHEVLLGGGLLSGDEQDDEELTDLTAIFLGMGVFTANSAFKEYTYEFRTYSASALGRAGYLNELQCSYALAVLSWIGRSTDHAWTRWLRQDQRTAFLAGVRYLQGCQDLILNADRLDHPVRVSHQQAELITWLADSSEARRMLALIKLGELEFDVKQVEAALLPLLEHHQRSIREAALSLLSEVEQPWSSSVLPVLAKMACSEHESEFRAVLTSLANRPPPADLKLVNRVTWTEHLECQLRDSSRRYAVEAAEALAGLCTADNERVMQLIQDLFVEAVLHNRMSPERLWHALEKILPDPRGALEQRLGRRSPAILEAVDEFLLHMHAAENPPDFDDDDDDDDDWGKFY